MSSDGQLWAAPFGFELPDPYIPEVTMPAIRASLPCRDLSSYLSTVSIPGSSWGFLSYQDSYHYRGCPESWVLYFPETQLFLAHG